MTIEESLAAAAEALGNVAAELASTAERPPDECMREAFAMLRAHLRLARVQPRTSHQLWRTRLVIYAEDDTTREVLGDSEPDLPGDHLPTTVIAGLPAVMAWAQDVIANWGEGHAVGPDTAAVTRAHNTLRVTISRGKGKGGVNLRFVLDGRPYVCRVMVWRVVE